MMFLIHRSRPSRKFLSLNRVTTENRSWEKSHLIQTYLEIWLQISENTLTCIMTSTSQQSSLAFPVEWLVSQLGNKEIQFNFIARLISGND